MTAIDDDACLLNVLNRLVRALEPPRPGGLPRAAKVSAAGVPQRWEDRDYVYMEANLSDADGEEIDISIHGGLVFIRIVR